MMIKTPRIRLRCWRESDREAFAALNADPEVMLDQGGPLSREKSDAKLDRCIAAFDRYGFCRWVTEGRDGEFLGYAGIMPLRPLTRRSRMSSIAQGWEKCSPIPALTI